MPGMSSSTSRIAALSILLTMSVAQLAFPIQPVLAADQEPRAMPRKPLPPEIDLEHRDNAAMEIADLYLGPEDWRSGQTIKLEATYNEALSLKDVLDQVVAHSLPIRISKESWQYQKGQLFASMAGFAPSYSLFYKKTGYTVLPNTRAPSQLFLSEVRYPVFLGGAVLYKTLGQSYRNSAWRNAYHATIDDALLNGYKRYSDLVLNTMLLRIRTKSVRLAEANLRLNEAMYQAGTATQFNIMQSRNQLGTEREKLSSAKLATRTAAMNLAFVINCPMSVNLMPRVAALSEERIIEPTLKVDHFLETALKKRPELRQYEQFRLAAARTVQTAAASLYPSVSLFTAYTAAASGISIPANEDDLNGVAAAEVAQAEENIGVVTNTALDQTASFSPGYNNTAKEGANTLTDVVAGSGGTPIANIQGGSLVTSGAVKPIFTASSLTGAPSTSNIQGSDTAGAGIFPGRSRNFQKGMNLSWALSNMGLSPVGSVLSARALSRQSSMQANQELLLVLKQVRAAYLNTIVSRHRIDAAAQAAGYGREAVRLARLRLKAGVGSNLELIQAQNDYISALIDQARAIAGTNQAQAQLLHDSGIISVESLTANGQ